MKIRMHVHRIKAGGSTALTISKRDMRVMQKLIKNQVKFEIEYIYDKFTIR
jgi:hypothetical protein